jgi:hypothetical protein
VSPGATYFGLIRLVHRIGLVRHSISLRPGDRRCVGPGPEGVRPR